MVAITRQWLYNVRIRLWDFDGEERYANYFNFLVEPEADKYSLYVGTYSGNAGNYLAYHNQKYFSAIDNDNNLSQSNCANITRSGNWIGSCSTYVGLTSVYHFSPNLEQPWIGIIWYGWKGEYYSLK